MHQGADRDGCHSYSILAQMTICEKLGHQSCSVMVKLFPNALLLALLLSLLAGVPVIAKQGEWEKYRNQLLGPMRVKLMESCALGHKFNAAKISYWEPKSSQRLQNYVLSQGETLKKFLAYTSGEAAAMKTACPNVW